MSEQQLELFAIENWMRRRDFGPDVPEDREQMARQIWERIQEEADQPAERTNHEG